MKRIGIIGAGAWGTALAITIRRTGREVILWARENEVVASINHHKINKLYLPGIPIENITATTSMSEVTDADAIFLVVPAQHLRDTCRKLMPYMPSKIPLIICAKGIEVESGSTMSEIVAAELPDAPVAILSGPTFAIEVARGLPTAATLACKDRDMGEQLVDTLGSLYFRPYYSDDIAGVEMGGAVKNVLAIASGIIEGKNYGDNARAAMIARGLAELVRLSVSCGGRAETCMGLSGLGDLILTASSIQSRNYSLGVALGKGKSLASILGKRNSVTEGVTSAKAVNALAKKNGVEMPICSTIDNMLHNNLPLDEAIASLLSRPFKAEFPVVPV